MEKSKINKILKVIITILVLLILALIVQQTYIRYDGKIDKSNSMSKSEIIELLKKGEQYNNYLIIYKPNKSSITSSMLIYPEPEQRVYVKDKIMKSVIGDKVFRYVNYNTKESITIFDHLQAFISNTEEKFAVLAYTRECIEDEERYSFEYIGEKEINNRKTIVIKLIDNKSSDNDYTKVYIDKETGVQYNSIYFYYKGPILIKDDENMSIEFDCVTDEDVKRPNIAGYMIFDDRKNT